jgi:hypothetical protein
MRHLQRRHTGAAPTTEVPMKSIDRVAPSHGAPNAFLKLLAFPFHRKGS